MDGPVAYQFDTPPGPGEVRDVAPGIGWLRMPLPFRLDHVNLWLLDDGDGVCVVDTGIDAGDTRALWQALLAGPLAGRPLTRIVVTHFHPDHLGVAGWLAERSGAAVWMTEAEARTARAWAARDGGTSPEACQAFYHAAGLADPSVPGVGRRPEGYGDQVAPLPASVRPLADGEVLAIGGRDWRVMVGHGHSPAHAALACEEAGVLIAGDQILPRISPVIAVWPDDPEADPLGDFLAGLPAYATLPAETLVLPGHDGPFRGLHRRLEELAHHHDGRLEKTLAACARPASAFEVLCHLFPRELDDHQVFFAVGETLAHLHYLVGRGRLARRRDVDGVDRYHHMDGETERSSQP